MIIIEDSTLTQKGHHEIKLSFEIVVTAEEARHKVRWWLRDHVGMLLDADPPTLAVGEKTVWRVPIYLSYPHTGRLSNVGVAQVDVITGEIADPAGTKKAMEEYFEKELKHRVPPFPLPEEETYQTPPPHALAIHDKSENKT